MRRQATEEQKARAAEKRSNMRTLAARISKMSDSERAELSARLPGVVTIEGRALSMHNQFMIAFQMPRATVVGGFRQWKTAGRSVMKGQHGACIWFPLGDKKQDGTGDASGAGDDKQSQRFGLATVFDVSQTEDSATADARRREATAAAETKESRAEWKDQTDREGAVSPATPSPDWSDLAYERPSPDWSDLAYEDSCREACGL